jgi:hypothetical protein
LTAAYNANPSRHWLDNALLYQEESLRTTNTFTTVDVEETKTVLQVLLVFVPMPFFWAIYLYVLLRTA